MAEHPSGLDLIYYPHLGKNGPKPAVTEVGKWSAAYCKPGFKTL